LIPKELSELFSEIHFNNYPFVTIPQHFEDDRGSIRNIADGNLGDVAVIHSKRGARRANHVHEIDWHLSYVVSGSMNYMWNNEEGSEESVTVMQDQMVYSPPGVPHMMIFLEDTVFIAVAAQNRSSAHYESDTKRLDPNHFSQ